MMAMAATDNISPGTMLKAKIGISHRDVANGYYKINEGDLVMVLAHHHIVDNSVPYNSERYEQVIMLPSGDAVLYLFSAMGYWKLFDVL